jgi:hexosaminidase
MVRGVRIIPEIDSPGHAGRSWIDAFNDSKSFLTCNDIFGQLNPTLDSSYEVIKNVFKQLFELFPDTMVHLGGD